MTAAMFTCYLTKKASLICWYKDIIPYSPTVADWPWILK